jgi:hypothetical protein
MAKRGRRAGATIDGLGDVVASIRARRDALMEDVAKLERVLAEFGADVGRRVRNLTAGIPGRKRRGGRRGARGRGSRAPGKDTLGGKVLTALRTGQKTNAELVAAVRLPVRKRSQLSVTLNNLKKRGYVMSPARGTWRATGADSSGG